MVARKGIRGNRVWKFIVAMAILSACMGCELGDTYSRDFLDTFEVGADHAIAQSNRICALEFDAVLEGEEPVEISDAEWRDVEACNALDLSQIVIRTIENAHAKETRCDSVETIQVLIDGGERKEAIEKTLCQRVQTECREDASYCAGIDPNENPNFRHVYNFRYCPKDYEYIDEGEQKLCVKAVCGGVSVKVKTDSQNCGSCGFVCGAGDKCENGQCISADSTKVYCNGKYIDPLSDLSHCGARGDCLGENSGKACTSGYSCADGNCVLACMDGQLLCDGKCITPGTDMIYCGASGDCSGQNKGKTCPSGTSCQGGTCEAGCIDGQVLCDGKCITPGTDMIYCGASGNCSGQNKGKTCPSGTSCQGGTCEAGCIDGQVLCDGKCITPGTDMIYCGASGNCSGQNKGKTCPSGTSCQGGTCEAGCVSGQLLCDGKCITPGTDMIYCGASGDCSGRNKGKTCPSGTSCQGGTCEAGCVSGQVLCDGKCITPGTDMIYCGASGDCSGQNKGKTCPSGTSCQGGTCEAGCVSGQLLCDGKCITPGTDMIYCGASGDCSGQNKGKTCPSGTSCQGGTCEAGCVSGQVLCDGKCITPGTDMIYCGASGDCSGRNKGTTCPSGTSCQGGTCEAGCIDGQLLCDGKCITPTTDMLHCGAKGACNATDASSSNYNGQACVNGKVCVNGACVQNSCTGTLTLCATQAGNQCIDIKGNDANHCGACNYKCSEHHLVNASSTSCSVGECQYACTGTYVNVGTGNTASTIYCINPEADNLYCGATGMDDKGRTCSSELKCMGGKCVAP